MNDNTKLLDKLARDITLYQTDAGRKMQAYSEMHEMLIRCVVSHPDGDPKGTIDGEAAREYFTKNLSKTIVETYEKEDPKLLEGMNTHKEGVDGFIREQWFYQPLYYRDGFHLKTKRVKEGESYFENMPEFHKKLLDMTPEEFAAFEHEDMKKRAIDAEIPK